MTEPNGFGPYELRGLLGRGGMGEVHLAYDQQHEREVALKLLPAELAGNTAFVERFGQECHAVAQLTDPHVIPVHRFGEIDGRPFIDMRLVEGMDLARLLDREGALPADRAVGLVEQAARALDAAHRAGLLHRDVKPSNLLVAPHDFVYLVDFGLAEAIGAAHSELPGERNTVGTPDYLAPERLIEGRETDVRADVYSLACVLFECLTGRPPFPLDSPAEVVQAQLSRRPPRVTELQDGLPAALDTVLARGMAKVPEARYGSAGELADAARAALEAETPAVVPQWQFQSLDVGLDELLGAAPRAGASGPVTRPVRRPGVGRRSVRVLAAAGAGAALVVVGAVLGTTAFRPDAEVLDATGSAPHTSQPAPSTTLATLAPQPVTPSPAAASAPVTEEVPTTTLAPRTTRAVAPAPRTTRRPVPRPSSTPPPPPPSTPTTSVPPPTTAAPTTTAAPSTTEAPPPPTTTSEPAPPSTTSHPTTTPPTSAPSTSPTPPTPTPPTTRPVPSQPQR